MIRCHHRRGLLPGGPDHPMAWPMKFRSGSNSPVPRREQEGLQSALRCSLRLLCDHEATARVKTSNPRRDVRSGWIPDLRPDPLEQLGRGEATVEVALQGDVKARILSAGTVSFNPSRCRYYGTANT